MEQQDLSLLQQLEQHTPATDFFHALPHKWNCAQAIFKAYQFYTQLTDEQIEELYRSKGGGRAEKGLCGALYAATIILGENTQEAQQIVDEFNAKLGNYTCKALKVELKIPCNLTVAVADKLLEEHLRKKFSC